MTTSFNPARLAAVRAAMQAWQRRLVDLGGANNLLWHREENAPSFDLTMAHPAGLAKLLSGEPVHLRSLVQNPRSERRARIALESIRIQTQSDLEQRGVVSCFLASGCVTWQATPSQGQLIADAPILLRQMEIRRRGDDYILTTSPYAEFNSALAAYLDVRGVHLDPLALEAIAHTPAGIDIRPVYAELQRLTSEISGFAIHHRLLIGNYSYEKLALVRDVAEMDASGSTVIAALAGVENAQKITKQHQERNPEAPDEQQLLVLDVDGGQEQIIADVLAGEHAAIIGPPGTGKSQTIAALIAALAAAGKSTLFVAQHNSALESVLQRLDAVGLRSLVAQPRQNPQETFGPLVQAAIAGRAATRTRPAEEELEDFADERPDEEVKSTMRVAHRALHEHVTALHAVHEPYGVSAYAVQSLVAEASAWARPPQLRARISPADLQHIDAKQRDDIATRLIRMARNEAWTAAGVDDPWFGALLIDENEREHAGEIVEALASGECARLQETMAATSKDAGLSPPNSPRQAREHLDLLREVDAVLDKARNGVFCARLEKYVAATAPRGQRIAGMPFLDRRALVKEARTLIRPRAAHAVHEVLQQAFQVQNRWKEQGGVRQPTIPSNAARGAKALDTLLEHLEWLQERLQPTGIGSLEGMSFARLQTFLEELFTHIDRAQAAANNFADSEILRSFGLGTLLAEVSQAGIGVDRIGAEWSFVWASSVLEAIRDGDPAYERKAGDELRSLAEKFADADVTMVERASAQVAAQVSAHAVQVCQDNLAEAKSLQKVLANLRPGAGLLVDDVSNHRRVLPALAPCWAMSPLVVPGTIPADMTFDVLIVDEASQVAAAEVVSAIARSRQVVVAGDPQQWAPAPAVPSVTKNRHINVAAAVPLEEDPTSPASAVPSLLDESAQCFPVHTLSWHYRSADERLVGFANESVYGHEMATFPSPQAHDVLRLHIPDFRKAPEDETPQTREQRYVDAQVAQTVRILSQHAANTPDESIAVIALTDALAARIEDALWVAFTTDPVLVDFVSQPHRPLLVRPLRRVQGGERDAVVLVTGLFPDAVGKVDLRSINHPGQEKALTVAITRARRRLSVISGVDGTAVAIDQLRSPAARMLRDFLLYMQEHEQQVFAPVNSPDISEQPLWPAGAKRAETGPLPMRVQGKRRRAAATGSVALLRTNQLPDPPVGPLVADLARRLQEHGLRVHSNYGLGRTRIDLAIEHPIEPGRMLLAVETDGENYARMGSVRERDRLRIDGLLLRGWEHERVWTVDLFRDPARDASRLVNVVAHLVRQERR